MSGVDIDELKKISDGINEVFTNKKNNDVINSELPEAVVPEIGHTSIVKKKVGFKVPPTQFQEQSSDFMTIGCVKLPTQTIYLTLILIIIGCGLFYRIHMMEQFSEKEIKQTGKNQKE